ncbi:hypothetical protein [Streptomyces sp. BA2]|uniref:hypothetical protein n=1 Tax=Streptomyces sp. BA2 TaxID=436595 RepID=UPI001328606D|nr:hypothetical protein [Streptomyces sp. BA2]MWA13567.1 hypothetical protein [Streptomyces sp. BA2]
MGSDGSRSGPRPQSEPVCASCGRPVGTAIKRRKVLGVFVPVWGPGPCHNPQCDACVDEPQEGAKREAEADAEPARSDADDD